MKKRIKIFIIAFLFIITWALHSKSMAAANCKSVPEEDVKYVNATLTNINIEEYNAWQRGISTDEYYSLSLEERHQIDDKSMLFDSTDAKCYGGIQNGYVDIGKYGNSAGFVQGLAKDKLVNGNLSIIDKYTNGTSFFPTVNTNPYVYKEILSNWKFPFEKLQNGYYYFNSNEHHLLKDYSTKTLKLHRGSKSGFFPFNKCSDDTSIVSNRDLAFSVKLEIPFTMTNDGKIFNEATDMYEDMVFNFSGDDDVWVYVDDQLVLDLGGCHVELQGNIDFARNEVYYQNIYNVETGQNEVAVNKKAFADGMLSPGAHTLTLFYMERAGGESNLIASFNLQSGGVQANYIDIDTNKVLETESQSGAVGNEVTTSAKNIEGYTLVKKPEIESFTLTEELQTVNYYYAKNTKVTAKYVDEVTNKEIAEMVTINGKSGDSYTTNQKTIQDYDFTKVEGTTSGTMQGEPINIIYYYRHKSKVTVNYIDKETNELIDSLEKDVHEGDTFTSEERQYEDYKLVEKPENETVKIEKEDVTLNYYYQRLKFNLQIEMNLDRAYINGNYYGLNGKAGKIETEIRDATSKSSLQIYYNIKVTNNEERIGNGYITFTIPEGFIMQNSDWQIDENVATYKVTDLNIGETREYQIVLQKNEGVDVAGDIKAFVRIDSEKLEETTLEDNEDMNELAIMPRTGAVILNVTPWILVLTALAIVIVVKIKSAKNAK